MKNYKNQQKMKKNINFDLIIEIFAIPVWLATVIGTLEAIHWWLYVNNGLNESFSVILPFTIPFYFACFWLPFLVFFRIIFIWEPLRGKSLLAKLGAIAVFFVLFVIILITISSWFFFGRTGIFLDYEHLIFGASNLFAIIIHLIQAGRTLLFMVYGLATMTCILLIHYVSKSHVPKNRFIVKVFQLNVMLLIIGLLAELVIDYYYDKEIKYRHPIASLIGSMIDDGHASAMEIGTMPNLAKKGEKNEYYTLIGHNL